MKPLLPVGQACEQYQQEYCIGRSWYWDSEDPKVDYPYMANMYPAFTNRNRYCRKGWDEAAKEEKELFRDDSERILVDG